MWRIGGGRGRTIAYSMHARAHVEAAYIGKALRGNNMRVEGRMRKM
jgi:hypothetical protein